MSEHDDDLRTWDGPGWRQPDDDRRRGVQVSFRLACSCMYQPHSDGPGEDAVMPGAVRECVRNGHGDQVVVEVRVRLVKDQPPPASRGRQTVQT